MTDLEHVRRFWNANPLWTGESSYRPGSKEFFEEHRTVYVSDCFGGSFDLRFMPPAKAGGQKMRVLDLGCGIGFWTTEFAMRGIANLVAADLTPAALEITRQRLDAYGVTAELREDNAECLSFPDDSFDHVNCQGVIHYIYDGEANPIGKSYSRDEFVSMLKRHFDVEETYLHFFPVRAMSVKIPRALHAWLDRRVGFMIYASVRKPCAA